MTKHKKIPPETFVIVWQTSKSIDEFVERTGLNQPAAVTRANTYRKKGVPLKRFSKQLEYVRKNRSGLDYEALKNLAMKYHKWPYR